MNTNIVVSLSESFPLLTADVIPSGIPIPKVSSIAEYREDCVDQRGEFWRDVRTCLCDQKMSMLVDPDIRVFLVKIMRLRRSVEQARIGLLIVSR